jgi:hypothetical protein
MYTSYVPADCDIELKFQDPLLLAHSPMHVHTRIKSRYLGQFYTPIYSYMHVHACIYIYIYMYINNIPRLVLQLLMQSAQPSSSAPPINLSCVHIRIYLYIYMFVDKYVYIDTNIHRHQ